MRAKTLQKFSHWTYLYSCKKLVRGFGGIPDAAPRAQMQAAWQRAAAGNGLHPSCRGCRPPQPVGCPCCEANAAYRDGIPPTGSTPRNVRRISGGEDGGREGGRYRGSCSRRCKGSSAACYTLAATAELPMWRGHPNTLLGGVTGLRSGEQRNNACGYQQKFL